MRILVTNDDGINAEGLAAPERIASKLTDDVDEDLGLLLQRDGPLEESTDFLVV